MPSRLLTRLMGCCSAELQLSTCRPKGRRYLVPHQMSQPKQVMNARGLLEDRRRSELMFREGYWKSYGERFFVRNMTRG